MSTFLVTQASGTQSRWTIKHLLSKGDKVHALVRDPNRVPSELRESGITLFYGESTESDKVYEAAKGCTGAFLNTFPIPGLEAQQARTIVEACKKAGVRSVVAATTFCTDDKSKWDNDFARDCGLYDYYKSKSEIEEAVVGGGFDSYSFVRPGIIHTDYYEPGVGHNFPELPELGQLNHFLNKGIRMPHTDASDIGAVVAAALRDPAKYKGQGIPIIGEMQTIEEVADTLTKVTGKNIKVHKDTPEEYAKVKDGLLIIRFQRWMNEIDLTYEAGKAKKVQDDLGIKFTPMLKTMEREKESIVACVAKV